MFFFMSLGPLMNPRKFQYSSLTSFHPEMALNFGKSDTKKRNLKSPQKSFWVMMDGFHCIIGDANAPQEVLAC